MLLIVEDIVKELSKKQAVNLEAFSNELVIEKIKKRMHSLRIKTPQTYLDHFRQDSSEAELLVQEIGIKVSSFFRNSMAYEIIEQRLLPTIIDLNRRKKSHVIRIWSAGCCTGEEPYSIAILLHRILKDEIKNWQLHIFATDIDQKILNKAAEGVYHRDSLINTKLGIIDEYFTLVKEQFILKPVICSMVNFSFDDLSSTNKVAPAASIFGSFDLVLCRNVLIYFNVKTKQQVLQKIFKSLGHNGYLVLGESEWISEIKTGTLIEIDTKNRIYKKG